MRGAPQTGRVVEAPRKSPALQTRSGFSVEFERVEPRAAAQLGLLRGEYSRESFANQRKHAWTKTPRPRPRRFVLTHARDHTFVTSAA